MKHITECVVEITRNRVPGNCLWQKCWPCPLSQVPSWCSFWTRTVLPLPEVSLIPRSSWACFVESHSAPLAPLCMQLHDRGNLPTTSGCKAQESCLQLCLGGLYWILRIYSWRWPSSIGMRHKGTDGVPSLEIFKGCVDVALRDKSPLGLRRWGQQLNLILKIFSNLNHPLIVQMILCPEVGGTPRVPDVTAMEISPSLVAMMSRQWHTSCVILSSVQKTKPTSNIAVPRLLDSTLEESVIALTVLHSQLVSHRSSQAPSLSVCKDSLTTYENKQLYYDVWLSIKTTSNSWLDVGLTFYCSLDLLIEYVQINKTFC